MAVSRPGRCCWCSAPSGGAGRPEQRNASNRRRRPAARSANRSSTVPVEHRLVFALVRGANVVPRSVPFSPDSRGGNLASIRRRQPTGGVVLRSGPLSWCVGVWSLYPFFLSLRRLGPSMQNSRPVVDYSCSPRCWNCQRPRAVRPARRSRADHGRHLLRIALRTGASACWCSRPGLGDRRRRGFVVVASSVRNSGKPADPDRPDPTEPPQAPPAARTPAAALPLDHGHRPPSTVSSPCGFALSRPRARRRRRCRTRRRALLSGLTTASRVYRRRRERPRSASSARCRLGAGPGQAIHRVVVAATLESGDGLLPSRAPAATATSRSLRLSRDQRVPAGGLVGSLPTAVELTAVITSARSSKSCPSTSCPGADDQVDDPSAATRREPRRPQGQRQLLGEENCAVQVAAPASTDRSAR